jgi:hypothetical protein
MNDYFAGGKVTKYQVKFRKCKRNFSESSQIRFIDLKKKIIQIALSVIAPIGLAFAVLNTPGPLSCQVRSFWPQGNLDCPQGVWHTRD